MTWPEKESLDEMMARFARKCLAERKDRPKIAAPIVAPVEPAERLERPPLRRSPLPPETQRFPTDEELDRMWGKR